MKEEQLIVNRLSEIDNDIKSWRDDLAKELKEPSEWRDEGYVTHCRVIISEFQSEKNTLIWVLGYTPSLTPQTEPV